MDRALSFRVVGLFILLITICCVQCGTVDEWQLWKQKYNKRYDNEADEGRHYDVWLRNYDLVQRHNYDADKSFTLEMNYLADQKIHRQHLHYNVDDGERSEGFRFAPASWDWRSKGAIGPVKNQGQLGDAMAFAASDCVASFHAIHTGQLVNPSFAEVHDCCSKNPISSTVGVFDCIHNIGGLCSQADYPKSVGKCMNTTCIPQVQINGGQQVPKGDEVAMTDAVYQTPVMALIDAGHASFQLYRSGVYSDPACSANRLDHAVQVVGYGSMDGHDYWICKNSWGTSWGMDGYILIARNKGNMCGIATMTSYPV